MLNFFLQTNKIFYEFDVGVAIQANVGGVFSGLPRHYAVLVFVSRLQVAHFVLLNAKLPFTISPLLRISLAYARLHTSHKTIHRIVLFGRVQKPYSYSAFKLL
jgi:hypothetical protein